MIAGLFDGDRTRCLQTIPKVLKEKDRRKHILLWKNNWLEMNMTEESNRIRWVHECLGVGTVYVRNHQVKNVVNKWVDACNGDGVVVREKHTRYVA